MWLFNVIQEIRIWLKIRKIANENRNLLKEKGFRIDWIGRIYTVINIPDEIFTSAMTNESYVYMKLQEFSPVFLEIGIADYVSPEVEEIEGAGAFLLIISPNRNYFRLWEFIKFLVKTLFVFLIIRILYIILTLDPVMNFFTRIFNLIINGN